MKAHIIQLLKTAIDHLQQQNYLPAESLATIQVEHTRDKQHGDFASNVALMLAKSAHKNPRELAEKIIAAIPSSERIQKIDLAGPGFINFTLASHVWQKVVPAILKEKEEYGISNIGKAQPILMEFVSSNPTGPLHVGHGRSAAYGGALSNLLEAVGFAIHREYYVNDGGRQMDILATSVWLRYLEDQGAVFAFPSNGYRGDYVLTIARSLQKKYGDRFQREIIDVFKDIPADEPEGGDKEIHIDALIERTKKFLDDENYTLILDETLAVVLADIKNDLSEFGLEYQQWFSERQLLKQGAVQHAIEKLSEKKHVYEKDGALWFRSTTFGDDKDRVLLRENGQPTYFAVDVAYHLNKFERGFPFLINIFGADHHGYIPRLRASIVALGYKPEQLMFLTVQFAVLYRGKERVQMSTRSGSFVTLRELREEVSTDAARFFYVLRRCEQHMDFDLELAKSQSNENPVFYVQYAHARICSVLRQASERGFDTEANALSDIARLVEPHEEALLAELARYPEVVTLAATQYEPHLIAHYLRDLANAFHSYYNACPFLVDDVALRNARLTLIIATRQVLRNGLKILGVSAPEQM